MGGAMPAREMWGILAFKMGGDDGPLFGTIAVHELNNLFSFQ